MKTINQNLTRDKDKFISSHYVKVPLSNNMFHYVMTGIIIINEKGTSSSNWNWEEFEIILKVPALLSNKKFLVENWAPNVTINSIYNQGRSVNSGFAVDWFNLKDIDVQNGIRDIKLRLSTAVRDTDAYLYRIGYSISLTGKII